MESIDSIILHWESRYKKKIHMVQTQKYKMISHAFIPFNIFTAILIWEVFCLRIYKGKIFK